MIDDGCWKQVWAEMMDSELEDRCVYVSLALDPHSECARRPGAQLIEEAERRGRTGIVERARMRAKTTPAAEPE